MTSLKLVGSMIQGVWKQSLFIIALLFLTIGNLSSKASADPVLVPHAFVVELTSPLVINCFGPNTNPLEQTCSGSLSDIAGFVTNEVGPEPFRDDPNTPHDVLVDIEVSGNAQQVSLFEVTITSINETNQLILNSAADLGYDSMTVTSKSGTGAGQWYVDNVNSAFTLGLPFTLAVNTLTISSLIVAYGGNIDSAALPELPVSLIWILILIGVSLIPLRAAIFKRR